MYRASNILDITFPRMPPKKVVNVFKKNWYLNTTEILINHLKLKKIPTLLKMLTMIEVKPIKNILVRAS